MIIFLEFDNSDVENEEPVEEEEESDGGQR